MKDQQKINPAIKVPLSELSEELQKFRNIFEDRESSIMLPKHQPWNLKIEFMKEHEDRIKLQKMRQYSYDELEIMKKKMDELLVK